jgi:hypothetical protein
MHGRVRAAGALIEYDDVYGELCVAFAAAQKSYDPTRGITFTAYLGACCFNRFNKFAEKWIAEQHTLGLIRNSEFESLDSGGERERGHSYMDYADRSFYEDELSKSLSPEEIVERKQDFFRKIQGLSHVSRDYVTSLLGRRTNHRDKPFTASEIRHIKKELFEVYGVALNQIRHEPRVTA